MSRSAVGLVCGFLLAGGVGASVAATGDDDFYRGKTIRLIVAFSAAGS